MERGTKALELRAAVAECKEMVKTNLMPLFNFVAKATVDIWSAWMEELDLCKKPKKKMVKRRREKPAGPKRCKKAKHHVAAFLSPSL